MIIPQYWAEAVLEAEINGRTVRVQRWGWSETSEVEAAQHARQRAEDALERIRRGERGVRRREPCREYGNGEGLPIREEIVERHGSVVLTRNGYGALCLNTADVLFADVDIEVPSYFPNLFALTAIGAIVAGWLTRSFWIAVGTWFVLSVIAAVLELLWRRAVLRRRNQEMLQKLEQFLQQHPAWHVRVYRTPAGFRLLAMHSTFDPSGPETQQFFEHMDVDPRYRNLCRIQRCFRARVSPKPWRIGLEDRIVPRPGVWPPPPEVLDRREQWIRRYEEAAQGYAACELLTELGSGRVHPTCRDVQELHDRLCRVGSGLPIA